MSASYTEQEMREMFLKNIRDIAKYWDNVERETTLEKIHGAMFSMLNIIDGNAGATPCSFDIVARPHPSDKEYLIDNDEQWVEDGMVINSDCHLHEFYYE